MGKTRIKQKPSKAVRFMNLLIVLTLLMMLISLGIMTRELHRVFARDMYTSIDYALQQGDYAEMVQDYYRRSFDVAPFSSAYEEEYYVAQYADAAFRHQFFRTIGDEAKAGRYEEQMESARTASGSLAAAAEDVDRLLEGITLYP